VPPLRIEPLSDQHDRESFASGIEPLDRYLRQQAGQDARRRVATCFVLVDDDDRVPLGYYTLAATSIALAELPEALAKRLPRYPVVPATLMGRLAVDARHQERGHGEFMLLDAFSRVLRNEIAFYAFVVDAKDDKAAQFYQRYRFRYLVDGAKDYSSPWPSSPNCFRSILKMASSARQKNVDIFLTDRNRKILRRWMDG
jgi:GNAT superfamily N-acetyltransferase